MTARTRPASLTLRCIAAVPVPSRRRPMKSLAPAWPGAQGDRIFVQPGAATTPFKDVGHQTPLTLLPIRTGLPWPIPQAV